MVKRKCAWLILAGRGVLLLGLCMAMLLTAASTLAAPANAYVRVVHAATDAGPVDVFVDNTKLLSNLTFGTVTKYDAVRAGSHTIRIVPTGKGVGAAVAHQTVAFTANVPYTLAAIGEKKPGYGLQAFTDNDQLNKGTEKVRVYHLSPNLGAVNVTEGGKTVIHNLSYKSASAYLSVPPAGYTFDVITAQKHTIPVKETVRANTVNSIFAIGLYQGNPALKFVVNSVKGGIGQPQAASNPGAPAPLVIINSPA
jgi:hypothetical protein